MKLQILRTAYCLPLLYLLFANIRGTSGIGSCFYASKEKLDWFNALFECMKLNLCLAVTANKHMFDQTGKELNKISREDYWIGLNSYEAYSFKFVSSQVSLKYVPPGSSFSPLKPCGYLKPNDQSTATTEAGDSEQPESEPPYTYATDVCHEKKKFVCSQATNCNGILLNTTWTDLPPEKPPCVIPPNVAQILGLDEFYDAEDESEVDPYD